MCGGAFAKAFYGCEISYIAQTKFREVRRAVQFALIRKGRHASSSAFCLLVADGSTEPLLWCLSRHLRHFRAAFYFRGIEWSLFCETIVEPANHNKLYGPSVFRRYCVLLDLVVSRMGALSFLRVFVFTGRHVHSDLASRSLAADLPIFDPTSTREALKSAVRIHLSGGIVTRSHLAHSRGCAPPCAFCDQKDAVSHRVLDCPKTADLREACPAISGLSAFRQSCRLGQPTHFDLVARLSDAIADASIRRVRISKVKSHQSNWISGTTGETLQRKRPLVLP